MLSFTSPEFYSTNCHGSMGIHTNITGNVGLIGSNVYGVDLVGNSSGGFPIQFCLNVSG